MEVNMSRYQSTMGIGVLALLLFFTSSFAMGGNENRPGLTPDTRMEKKPFLLAIDIDKDMLSAKIKKAPLEAVLEELKQKTHLTIEVNGSLAGETVSVEFDPLPLEKGLHTLLRNKSYILTYSRVVSEDGSAPQFRVEGIKVAGKGTMSPLSPLNEEPGRRGWPQESFRQHSEGIPDPIAPPAPPANTEETKPEVSDHEEEPSIDTLKTTIISSSDADTRMNAIDDLAYRTGRDAVSILKQVAKSDPDSDVREYAQDLIEQVEEDSLNPEEDSSLEDASEEDASN
jgi:hypothetical protein